MPNRLPDPMTQRRASVRPASSAFADLTASDRLVLVFLAGLAVLALARHPQPWLFASLIAGLALAICATTFWASRSRVGRWVHDFFPIVSVPCLFNLSGPLIAVVNPARWDATLAGVDRALFGPLVPLWFGALGRPWWLTDVASLLYVAYYAIPVAMAVALYRAGRLADFDREVFTVVGTFVLSYLCYFLFPTSGPRVPFEDQSRILGGSAVSDAVRWFLYAGEINVLDAFPSGHTALSLVFLGLGWRLFPSWRWRAPLVLLVGGTIFATVYLSLHYVIDLVAGVALAALMPWVLPPLRRCLGAHEAAPPRPAPR